MITRGAESVLHDIVDNINMFLQRNEQAYQIGLDVEDRERYLLVDGMKKKEYYGMIRLYTIHEGEGKLLLWREEMTFYNLSERRKALTWKDQLAKICIYEALGSFIAIQRANVIENIAKLAKEPHGNYKWKEDYYEQVVPKAEEEADGVVS